MSLAFGRVNVAALLLVVAWRLGVVEGKVETGTLSLGGPLDEHRWSYLSKFGFATGTGTYSMRLRLAEPLPEAEGARVDLNIFLDEDWPHVESLPPCRRERDAPSRANHAIMLDRVGEWTHWQNGSLLQSIRPHIWYFALSDCRREFAANTTGSVDYEIHFHQFDGSEFSVENRHMLSLGCLALVLFSAFFARHVARCRSFRLSAGAVHEVIWVLTKAMALQYAAQALHLLHLWRYRADGMGAPALDTLSEVLFMLSQVTQTTLLIAIAMGYTLLSAKAAEMNLVRPIASVAFVVHAALVGVCKFQGDHSYKYHENEGLVGWVLLGIRALLYAWFMLSLRRCHAKGGPRLQPFLQQFQLAGTVYFLAYPVIFIVVQVFAPYLQHPLMHCGLLAMQTASHAWLSQLFLSRGTYFRVSALSNSLLPGGGGFHACFGKQD